MDEYLLQIREVTDEFFKATTFELSEIEISERDGACLIEINLNNPKVFIGERGQTLSEIQHLLRIIVRKRVNPDIIIELDVDGYRKKKREALSDIANDIANEVIYRKREKILPVMNPYERRIIHMALKERDGVETESIGEEPERRVVIRPANYS